MTLVVKNPPTSAGDKGDISLIPGSGRSPERAAWQPSLIFLPGESHDRGAWRAAVHGATKSQTRLSD